MATGAFLHPFASTTRAEFIQIVSGQGARVRDAGGREYVDGMASLWCVNAGYGRDEIVDAVAEQMRRLPVFHCFEPFTNGPADELAARIAALAPLDHPRVFFTCSGSEAVDSAIKLARMAQRQAGHPERTIVVSRSRAYHGVTYGGMTAQGLPLNREGFGPFVEGMVNLPADDVEAMAAFLAEHGHEVAAVLTEPVQGAGGVYPPDEGYLPALRRLCDQHGCYLILDEVICGFGRLGTWFGAERFGVRPDLLTFAKGVTSGYQPLGGVIVGRGPREALESDPSFVLRHGHTYSGHPAPCAAGLANLAIVEREDLAAGAGRIASRLGGGLAALAADGVIAEARGDGGMWAAGLHPHQDATKLRDAMFAAGVITRALGAPTLTFCPPLVIDDADLDRIVDALASAAK